MNLIIDIYLSMPLHGLVFIIASLPLLPARNILLWSLLGLIKWKPFSSERGCHTLINYILNRTKIQNLLLQYK